MREIAKERTSNLEALFTNTSKKTGLSPAIIEKDFWVCWLLDYLFHDSLWCGHLAFKGGTSLSKAFNLIKRFSEDIDLILDWRLLGYGRDEPWQTRSNTQQDIFNEKANARSADFLKSKFAPKLKLDLSDELGKEVDIGIDEHDPNTVVFRYPCVFAEKSILREIRIENGMSDAALKQPYLLDAVVRFKQKFYRCAWAHYELATTREIRLSPPEGAIPSLEADYAHMRNMIFGPAPSFAEILAVIKKLETRMHAIASDENHAAVEVAERPTGGWRRHHRYRGNIPRTK